MTSSPLLDGVACGSRRSLCSPEGFPGLARGSSHPRGLAQVPLGPPPRSVGVSSSSSTSNVTSSLGGAASARVDGCDACATLVNNQTSSVGSSDDVDISRGLANSIACVGSSSSSNCIANTKSLKVSEVVEVKEYDPNTPLASGAANYTPHDAGEPTSGAGPPTPGVSIGCVVACNSCPNDNAHNGNLNITNANDAVVNDDGLEINSNNVDHQEEEAQETSLSHAADEHSSRRADRSGGRQIRSIDAPELRGRDRIRSPHQASTRTNARRLTLQAPKRAEDHQQALAASRADERGECQEESMQVSIGVGSVHGARGPFNGEAAEAHQLRRSFIATGDTNFKSLGKGHVSISGGGAGHGIADEPDRIGLLEVDQGSARPFIHGRTRHGDDEPACTGSIEVRSDTPTDPAAPEGHGMRSREPPGGAGRTQKSHDRSPRLCTRKELHASGQRSNGLSMLWRADQAPSRPSEKGDDLPHRIPAVHRRSYERDAHVRWSGPTIPSRASGATWHSTSASKIQPSNSDAFQIRPLQNSGYSQRSGSPDRQINNDAPFPLYVRDSAGPRRLDPVQVSFGRFTNEGAARGDAAAARASCNFGDSDEAADGRASCKGVDSDEIATGRTPCNQSDYDNASGVIDEIIANPSGGSPAQIWHVGNSKDGGVNLVKSSLVRSFKWPYEDIACARLGKLLLSQNHSSMTPHVLLVRGSKLNDAEPGGRVLTGVIKDWLRASWPIVVYVKNRKGLIHEVLSLIFTSVGSGGSWFPLCSCVGNLGEHNVGTLFTNLSGLQHTYIECAIDDRNKKKSHDWNGIAAESIFNRICNIHIACYIAKSDRHRCRDYLEPAVCSATKVGSATIPPQRPPGIEHEHALHPSDPGPEEEAPVEEETCSRSAAGVLAQLALLQPEVDHSSANCLGFGKGMQGGGDIGGSADIRGKAPNQKRVVMMIDEAYPTEQAVRQKKEREAREEKLADGGLTEEEIKKSRKKKKFHQEFRFDDCGSALAPLEEKPLTHAIACSDTLESAIAYSYFDYDACGSDSASSTEGESSKVLEDNCPLHYLVGSDGAKHHVGPPKATYIPLD